ncbi:MAG: bifunctional nuclease family protein [Planctomycetota bacterium]|nr:MAG: bifunctional nuclease family protein [Planctomycetota bacterium]
MGLVRTSAKTGEAASVIGAGAAPGRRARIAAVIEVRLSQLVVVEKGGYQFVRLEECEPASTAGRRVLTLVIGPAEAAEIGRCLSKEQTLRPLTHQLAFDILSRLGGKIERLVIHDLRDSTYYGRLDLATPQGPVELDCRPSDGIALSLRAGTPIFVAEKVMAEAGTVPG